MGEAGEASSEHSSDCTRPSGQIHTGGSWLGAVYGCCDPGLEMVMNRPIAFLLWGRPAQMKKSMLNNPKHLILEASLSKSSVCFTGDFSDVNISVKQTNFLLPMVWNQSIMI